MKTRQTDAVVMTIASYLKFDLSELALLSAWKRKGPSASARVLVHEGSHEIHFPLMQLRAAH